jgi:hypothetical protein
VQKPTILGAKENSAAYRFLTHSIGGPGTLLRKIPMPGDFQQLAYLKDCTEDHKVLHAREPPLGNSCPALGKTAEGRGAQLNGK